MKLSQLQGLNIGRQAYAKQWSLVLLSGGLQVETRSSSCCKSLSL